MLISFNVLIFRAAFDLHNSLNSSSGHTVKIDMFVLRIQNTHFS